MMSSYMELSHWTKRTGDSDYYKPGQLANSVEMAESRLNIYMKDFTSDYKINSNF